MHANPSAPPAVAGADDSFPLEIAGHTWEVRLLEGEMYVNGTKRPFLIDDPCSRIDIAHDPSDPEALAVNVAAIIENLWRVPKRGRGRRVGSHS